MALLNILKKQDKTKNEERSTPAIIDVEKTKTISSQARYADVLVQPLVTEKGTRQNTLNQYAFVVALSANKIDVQKAVEVVYHVRPVKVNMARVRGRKVRYGKTAGTTNAWKKAIVTLPKGKTIQIYEGV